MSAVGELFGRVRIDTSPLRTSRDFRLLFIGGSVSRVGSMVTYVCLPFQVKVYSYDEKGKRKPVKGATVTGASGPTAADGSATVTLVANEELRATHGKEIPSNSLPVCVEICP